MSTSVSPSDPSPNRKIGEKSNPAGDRTVKVLVIIAASISLLVVGFLVVYLQGSVQGVEFSPTHFQQREFSFYEIPLIHLQVTPIWRTLNTPATAAFVRQKSMIQVPLGQPTTWHLVSINRGLNGTVSDDAELLTDQLTLARNSEPYWLNWSSEQPKSAAVLWPVIQRLAQRELYILMPRIFEIALSEQTATELQHAIDDDLIDQYSSLIQDMVAAGRMVVAQQLVTEASADYPDAAPWKSYLVTTTP